MIECCEGCIYWQWRRKKRADAKPGHSLDEINRRMLDRMEARAREREVTLGMSWKIADSGGEGGDTDGDRTL